MKRAAWLLALLLVGQSEGGTQPVSFKPVAVQVPGSPFAASASQPTDVASGDWNADKKTDLAVIDQLGDRVTVLIGDGTTTFTQAIDFPVGTAPIAISAADLNLDGTSDLAVLNRGSRTVNLLAGNGTTFTPIRIIGLGGSGVPTAMAIGTFDADAIPDLAIATEGATSIQIFHGDGLYGFVASGLLASPTDISFMRGTDLDGNARTDLVVGSRNTGRVSVYVGGATGLGAPAGTMWSAPSRARATSPTSTPTPGWTSRSRTGDRATFPFFSRPRPARSARSPCSRSARSPPRSWPRTSTRTERGTS